MKGKMRLALFLLLLSSDPSRAHDLWVADVNGGYYAILRGHLPGILEPYNPPCIQELSALDEKGLPLALKRVDRERQVVFQAPSAPALVAVAAAWGVRVIDETGKKHFMSKAQAVEAGMAVKEAFFSAQYSKTLFRFHNSFTKPIGMKLEVVPQANPLILRKGDTLTIQVLLDGLPLSKAKVQRGGKAAAGETDANGIAEVRIDGTGWQKVAVVHDAPAPENSGLDYLRLSAFLVFPLK